MISEGIWVSSMIGVAVVAWLVVRMRNRSERGREEGNGRIAQELVFRVSLVGDNRAFVSWESGVDDLEKDDSVEESDQTPSRCEKRRIRFLIDGLFLSESFRFVCSAPAGDCGFREVFHYCTGVRVDAYTYVVGDRSNERGWFLTGLWTRAAST